MAKSTKETSSGVKYGRGTGVPDPIDVHVGARVRTRRLLIGMNQETLAKALGLTFQQVQKYEGGTNRVSASRLQEIADVLSVKVGYFYEGLPSGDTTDPTEAAARSRMQRPEAIELIRSYYTIADQECRRQLLEMVKAVAQSQRPRP